MKNHELIGVKVGDMNCNLLALRLEDGYGIGIAANKRGDLK